MSENPDLLLFWMTHLGEGSNSQLSRAIASLYRQPAHDDFLRISRSFRRHVEELGHVTWSGDRWYVERPSLTMLPDNSNCVLRGGRIPDIETRVSEAADLFNCKVTRRQISHAPTAIFVAGEPSAILAVCDKAGISLEQTLAVNLASIAEPIHCILTKSPQASVPLEQRFDSFDFSQMAWATDLKTSTALRYLTSRSIPRYLVEVSQNIYNSVSSDSEAVYISSSLEGQSICEYNASTLCFAAPYRLPLDYSRTLTLCSGVTPTFEKGKQTYSSVPAEIAAQILTALCPVRTRKIRWF